MLKSYYCLCRCNANVVIPNFLFSDRVSSYGDAEIQGSEKEEAEGGRSGNSTGMTDQIR